MRVKVVFEGSTHEIDVDSEERLSFLHFQLYSLTELAPEEQHLVFRHWNGAESKEETNPSEERYTQLVQAATTHPDSIPEVVVTRKAKNPAPVFVNPQAGMVAAMSWKECCTRSFLGAQTAQQPAFLLGDKPLCLACATTCHMPNAIKPYTKPAAIACQCPPDRCLFAQRVVTGAEIVGGAMLPPFLNLLKQAQQKHLSSMQSSGMQEMSGALESKLRMVLVYEEPTRQQRARQVIPVEALKEKAQLALATHLSEGKEKLGLADFLMLELLRWFKHDFFRWVNSPKCQMCDGKTKFVGGTQPNAEERRFMAGRVELHKCAGCGAHTRFPRFNDPNHLLETRAGRCGEWANAFGLCSRSLGFDTRAVHDWTDHVWVEYFSEAEGRWVHVDPCENIRDAPLTYECGWGKKLTYVIAFSRDGVQDVTQRYTKDFAEVLKRRTFVAEEWLAKQLGQMDHRQRTTLPADRRNQTLHRRAKEILRLRGLVQTEDRSLKSEEQRGRVTGTVEWRRARGELGKGSAGAVTAKEVQRAGEEKEVKDVVMKVEKEAPVKKKATVGEKRAAVKALFQRYHRQFTVGCGVSNCQNFLCLSSSQCTVKNLQPKQALALALKLATALDNSKLCARP